MRRQKPEWPPSAEELRRMYHEEKMSLSQIGEVFGKGKSAVLAQMKAHGIPRREPGIAPECPDCAHLRELYVTRGMSLAEVGAAIGKTSSAVSEYLRRCGIETRPVGKRARGDGRRGGCGGRLRRRRSCRRPGWSRWRGGRGEPAALSGADVVGAPGGAGAVWGGVEGAGG